MNMKSLKIGAVAKETGVSVKAIRFYEKIGLIPAPERSKLLGLTLAQIKEIVASFKGEGCDCNRLRPRLQKLVDEQLDEIDRQLRELTLLRTELTKIKKGTQRVPLPEGFCICSEIPVQLTRSGRAIAV